MVTEFQNVVERVFIYQQTEPLDRFLTANLFIKQFMNNVLPGEDVAKGIEGGGGNLQLGF